MGTIERMIQAIRELYADIPWYIMIAVFLAGYLFMRYISPLPVIN